MTYDEGKLRSLRREVEKNADIINRIVDTIIGKYVTELNKVIEDARNLIENKDRLTDTEIEDLVLRIPVYLYFAAEGLETLGVEGDNAKAIKSEAYNEAYLVAEGTIKDKEAAAELQTFSEQMIETAYTRAYKKLKAQIEKAEHVFSGAKKVLSKRMQEWEIARTELQYGKDVPNFERREE